jgi:hypothetical protein
MFVSALYVSFMPYMVYEKCNMEERISNLTSFRAKRRNSVLKEM